MRIRSVFILMSGLTLSSEAWSGGEKYRSPEDWNKQALNCLNNANGHRPNYERAERYFRRAMNGGSVEACFHLADLYRNNLPHPLGRDGARSASAISLYERAANAGHPGAQLELARFYHTGSRGVLRNLHHAKRYYRMAMAGGNHEARVHLGTLLEEEGRKAEAQVLYNDAHLQNIVLGTYRLALLVAEEDPSEASRLYERILQSDQASESIRVAARARLGELEVPIGPGESVNDLSSFEVEDVVVNPQPRLPASLSTRILGFFLRAAAVCLGDRRSR